MRNIIDNVTDLSAEIGEVILDSFMNDGLLKDIPFIGTGIKIISISTSFSDLILIRKLKILMNNLNILSQSDIDKFKENMSKDKSRIEICTKLINIINRTDEDIKIELIAKAFLNYINKKIEKDFFLRIITIINNTFIKDIQRLREIEGKILSNNRKIESYILHQLFSNGLLNNCGINGGGAANDSDNGTIYMVNIFGGYIKNELL